MLFEGVPGFVNAWVSKGVVVGVGLASILGSVLGWRHAWTLYLPGVVRNGQVWRLATAPWAFGSAAELMLGLLLLYYFRQFERQLSGPKFAMFAMLVTSVATLLQIGLLSLLAPYGVVALLPGPYGLIFACLVKFYYDVPMTYRFTVAHLPLNNKLFVYVLGAQLALASGLHSLAVAATGVAAGLLYRSDLGGMHSMVVPKAVTAVCVKCLLPVLAPLPSRPFAPPPATGSGGTSGDASAEDVRLVPFSIPMTALPFTRTPVNRASRSNAAGGRTSGGDDDLHDLFGSSASDDAHQFNGRGDELV
ncbi:UBA/TS-N domain-containing protein [Thecamonas trahens ATCC 50062]|uniref:UBA/TS-N domain-containing protein n=1 Tax=Thecamonas trahens ATCC 50062 TaxID=461836 RepID=A0A0L0D6N9_THETB|nr:UBA/TS-N domain-containing protein [Thecamonas trahens ATCC 50062]KNC48042.1 UBA/TS-N domain-containing protein [Thecamonas trahens ATCC 50062]|eukprot:XP_013759057.1 UBA/TS-N domain-containing protein [Thecamonas trahens ATCC 50062]